MCSLCRGARIFILLITVVFRGQTSIKGASKQAKKMERHIVSTYQSLSESSVCF